MQLHSALVHNGGGSLLFCQSRIDFCGSFFHAEQLLLAGSHILDGDLALGDLVLTEEELTERDALRKEYIAEWRRGAEQVLENTYIITPDGTKRKLQKKQ